MKMFEKGQVVIAQAHPEPEEPGIFQVQVPFGSEVSYSFYDLEVDKHAVMYEGGTFYLNDNEISNKPNESENVQDGILDLTFKMPLIFKKPTFEDQMKSIQEYAIPLVSPNLAEEWNKMPVYKHFVIADEWTREYGSAYGSTNKCECGSDAIKSPRHSNWCPKHDAA